MLRGKTRTDGDVDMKLAWLFAFLVSVPIAVGTEHSLVNAKAPDFSLLDQYDRQFTLQSFAGQPVILIASDGEGAKQNDRWIDRIQEKYKERIRIEGVADVRAAPFFMKSMVKNDFKKSKASILLDWSGELFKPYGCAQDVSNVILIDAGGYIRYVHSGAATNEAAEQLFRKIDTFMEKK
jgi:hypothetical protein